MQEKVCQKVKKERKCSRLAFLVNLKKADLLYISCFIYYFILFNQIECIVYVRVTNVYFLVSMRIYGEEQEYS